MNNKTELNPEAPQRTEEQHVVCNGYTEEFKMDGMHEFNPPFLKFIRFDAQGNAIYEKQLNATAGQVLGQLWTAFRNWNVYERAKENARMHARAECEKICAKRTAPCGTNMYCKGTLIKEVFPDPPGPDQPIPLVRLPSLSQGSRNSLQPSGKYGIYYKIKGTFTCACSCELTRWGRIKQKVRDWFTPLSGDTGWWGGGFGTPGGSSDIDRQKKKYDSEKI